VSVAARCIWSDVGEASAGLGHMTKHPRQTSTVIGREIAKHAIRRFESK